MEYYWHTTILTWTSVHYSATPKKITSITISLIYRADSVFYSVVFYLHGYKLMWCLYCYAPTVLLYLLNRFRLLTNG